MLTRPIVVFRPVMPHQEAGSRTEPPVSVPIAHGARPAATATPEPLLDPPGVRCAAGPTGSTACRACELVPQPPIANSTVWVLPSTIMPCAIRRRASVAVRGGLAVAPDLGAAGDDPALDLDQVLQRDRDAVQRTDRVAGADRLVGASRGEPGVVGIDLDEGLQLRAPAPRCAPGTPRSTRSAKAAAPAVAATAAGRGGARDRVVTWVRLWGESGGADCSVFRKEPIYPWRRSKKN